MSVALWCLWSMAVLAACLWIPFIVGVNMHGDEQTTDFRKVPDKRNFPDWVQRADRAHMNLLEQLLPFAALVLVAEHLALRSAIIDWAAVVFVVSRLAHAVGMITALTLFPVRSIIFSLSWLCTLAIAGVIGLNAI